MIPYPGESLRVWDAVDITGGGEDTTLGGAIVVRAGTRTLASGTQWRMWAHPGTASYLEESGLDLDVSWVVEVVSGTVTLTAGELADPSYYDLTTSPSPLGTFTVTGPATLVIPSGFTADDIRSGSDAMMLELVGDSGSAVVQQVKMRAWPAGGALGGWSDPLPSWSTNPSFPVGYETAVVVNPNEVTADQESSWDATMAQGVADFAAAAPGPHTFTFIDSGAGYLAPSRGGSLSAFHSSGDGGITWGTNTSLSGAILVIAGQQWTSNPAINPALVNGVDYIRPPTEVNGEASAYVAQQIGSGSTGWVNPYALVGTSAEEAPVSAPTLDAGALDALTITNLGGGLRGIDLDAVVGAPLTTPGPSGSATESVGLPTGHPFIVVNLAHTAATSAPAWPAPGGLAGSAAGVLGFGVGTPGVDFDPMLTYAIMPPYRVWLPTVTTQSPHLIFYRTDNLGAGAAFVFGQDTRQSSGLVFGNT